MKVRTRTSRTGGASGRPTATRRKGKTGVRPQPPAINTHWTFMSNHGYVLACLARDPGVRLRDVALMVNITERAVQKIVADLEAAGILKRIREGRRNRYEVYRDRPLRHALGAHRTVGALLDLILTDGTGLPFRAPGETTGD